MNIREYLNFIRQQFQSRFQKKDAEQTNAFKLDFKKGEINLKIEDFLNWSLQNISGISRIELQKFIDKMAVWYEFRYPKQELLHLFSLNQEGERMHFVFKEKERYQDLLRILNSSEIENTSVVMDLANWKDLFDTKTFFEMLSYEEKSFLENPKFPMLYYFKERRGMLTLSENGIITHVHGNFPGEEWEKLNQWIGKPLSNMLGTLSEYKMNKDILAIHKLMNQYNKKLQFQAFLLDAVLYKIMERGGNIYGVERGYLFAREFKRDINIPFEYYRLKKHSFPLENLGKEGLTTTERQEIILHQKLIEILVNTVLKKEEMQKKKFFSK